MNCHMGADFIIHASAVRGAIPKESIDTFGANIGDSYQWAMDPADDSMLGTWHYRLVVSVCMLLTCGPTQEVPSS